MSQEVTKELNSKLMAVVDRDEIKQVSHRFARGLDRCDRSLIESCFHPEGTDDHGFFKGSGEEFCDWVMEELKKFDFTQHVISTQNIEISGSSAACESYFISFHGLPTPDGAKEVIVAGRYLDEMEKHNDKWKIKHRHCIFDWNRMTDASTLPSRDPDPRSIGQRSEKDHSYAMFKKML